MKDLVEYIVKQIVNNPEAVVVEESQGSDTVNLRLTVDPTDMGIVIGKAGQTIKAIRKLLTIRAIADNTRVNLELAEPAGVSPADQVDASEKSSETPTADDVDSDESKKVS